MFEIVSVSVGFILTQVFVFSLGFLYMVDYRARVSGTPYRFLHISATVVLLLLLLLVLLKTGKFVVYNSFLSENKDLAFRFLTVGIVFGLIAFPFTLRFSTRLLIPQSRL
ncbi:MAG: hypothetical protein GXO45_02370 [Aquificae bacterium]|nr:hypothetical protein [Aquificota bacterium]